MLSCSDAGFETGRFTIKAVLSNVWEKLIWNCNRPEALKHTELELMLN